MLVAWTAVFTELMALLAELMPFSCVASIASVADCWETKVAILPSCWATLPLIMLIESDWAATAEVVDATWAANTGTPATDVCSLSEE